MSSGLALAFLAAGCAGDRQQGGFNGGAQDEWLQRPPPFLTGPAALFLTNLDGYSAEATLAVETSSSGIHTISGRLLERQGKLFFEPIPVKSSRKRANQGQFTFIWDTAGGRGYVLSESLQGYAPTGSGNRFGPLSFQISAIPPRPFEDHTVSAADVTCAAGDGRQLSFQLLRAGDLNGLALRIESTNEPVPFTLTLSKVRIDRLAEGLFEPPEGFTKYQSEEALLSELAAREQSFQGTARERHTWTEPDFPGRDAGSPGGPDTGPGSRMGP